MILSVKQKFIIGVILLVVMATSASVFAASYANKKAFDLNLPHLNKNATAASAKKTTARSYGKVQVTKIGGGSDGVNCWMRTKKSNGEWDPLNSKYQTFKDTGTKTVYYKNSSTGYTIPHQKGASAQLRMENRTTTQFVKDNVKGNVWFN